MKKTFFVFLFFLFAWGAQAQSTPEKEALAATLVQKFSLTRVQAADAVRIEESTARRLMSLRMPHAEKELGREGVRKAEEEARQQRLQRLAGLVKDEATAKALSLYLDGKINPAAPPRRR